jgi:hypothetical protein
MQHVYRGLVSAAELVFDNWAFGDVLQDETLEVRRGPSTFPPKGRITTSRIGA